MDNLIQKLKKTVALEVLLFLRKNGSSGKTTLTQGVEASQTSVNSALTSLRQLGLIQDVEPVGRPLKLPVSLSEKGHRIAAHIVEVQKILAEN